VRNVRESAVAAGGRGRGGGGCPFTHGHRFRGDASTHHRRRPGRPARRPKLSGQLSSTCPQAVAALTIGRRAAVVTVRPVVLRRHRGSGAPFHVHPVQVWRPAARQHAVKRTGQHSGRFGGGASCTSAPPAPRGWRSERAADVAYDCVGGDRGRTVVFYRRTYY